jgi:N-ethylmaleimide reductase
MPGLATGRQTSAWKNVTAAVHAEQGLIFAQLMHAGGLSHPAARIDGGSPLAPSHYFGTKMVLTRQGRLRAAPALPMTPAQVSDAVSDFVTAATNAVLAGFDGVELHSANGYLMHQFLGDNSNSRTDRYGGTVAGRIRFAVEVVDAVAQVIGPERVAIRLSPGNPHGGLVERNPGPVYRSLIEELDRRPLAYLHFSDCGSDPALADVRSLWTGPLIANIGENRSSPTTLAEAQQLLAAGRADLVSFGRHFIANPDLPKRFRMNGELAPLEPATLYTHGAEGYIDYPHLAVG